MTRRVWAALALAAAAASPCVAQAPGMPFVPIGSPLDRAIIWAVDAGVMPALDPHTRPFRRIDVTRALARAPGAARTAAQREAVRRLEAAMDASADSTLLVAEAGIAAYRNGRRDGWRSGGGRGVAPFGGLLGMASSGPVSAVVNPAFENRLRDDPDFTGKTDRFIAGRMQAAYLAVTGPSFDVTIGRFARNWGPADEPGLLISTAAYPRDALSGSIRVGRLGLTALAQRLDDWDSTLAGSPLPVARYAFAHRLTADLGRGVWLSVHETGVYAGPGRGFDPVIHNPLNLVLLSEFNDGVDANVLLGADLAAPLGRGWRLEAEGFLDDIQVDRDPNRLSDRRPTSYGATVAFRWAAPSWPLHVALVLTRVTSLAYRNQFQPAQEYSVQRVGLGRNWSDYQQGTLRVDYRPRRDVGVRAEVGVLEQGSADFRQPYPSDSILALPGQGFLVPPVRRSVLGRLGGDARVGGMVDVRGEVGVADDGHVLAGLAASIPVDLLRRRAGPEYVAVERGAQRAWP